MGRKSLEKERTGQFIAAFIACIAQNGIAGTILEDEAKNRPIAWSKKDWRISTGFCRIPACPL